MLSPLGPPGRRRRRRGPSASVSAVAVTRSDRLTSCRCHRSRRDLRVSSRSARLPGAARATEHARPVAHARWGLRQPGRARAAGALAGWEEMEQSDKPGRCLGCQPVPSGRWRTGRVGRAGEGVAVLDWSLGAGWCTVTPRRSRRRGGRERVPRTPEDMPPGYQHFLSLLTQPGACRQVHL